MQQAPQSGLPQANLELHISCTNLADMDTFSKSDPMVVVFTKDGFGNWIEYGRTEMIKDNLNPKFVKSIMMEYRFEEEQRLRFAVYDIDNQNKLLDSQDFIGETTCALADIITARGQKLVRELQRRDRPGSRRGQIIIQSEEVQELNYNITLQFGATGLDKKDLFGKSDPFLVISRSREGGSYVPVVKTEVIKKTLDPVWRSFTTTVQKLCNGDIDRPLLFEVFDWNRSGKHDFIGQFKTSVRELTSGQKKEFEVIEESKKKKKRRYSNSGVVKLLHCEMVKSYSFIEYLVGGCDMNLIVAIDFTASNGDPNLSKSLHYNNPNSPNEYVKAITAVGEILRFYDSDQLFPVYGFGAKVPPTNQVSHCFPLNGNPNNPEVYGIQGILDIYYRSLNTVTLYGPTIFSQIIKTGFEIASQQNSQSEQHYYILLIITDGVINDMEATIDEIVQNNALPLSIVIVGVGDEDFTNMEVLDADDEPLRGSNGDIAKRDIVQFVPFREFKNAPMSRLAKETLEEIPGQLLSYMQSQGIKPNPPGSQPPSSNPSLTYGSQQQQPPTSWGQQPYQSQQQPYQQPQHYQQPPPSSYYQPQYPYQQPPPSYQQHPPPSQAYQQQARYPAYQQPPPTGYQPYQQPPPQSYQPQSYQQQPQYPYQQGPPPGSYQQPPNSYQPYPPPSYQPYQQRPY